MIANTPALLGRHCYDCDVLWPWHSAVHCHYNSPRANACARPIGGHGPTRPPNPLAERCLEGALSN